MKTTALERTKRILFGLGLLGAGSVFIIPLSNAAFLFGLMLIGFGVYPQSTEYPEDDMANAPEPELAKPVYSTPPVADMPAKAATKKVSRRKSRK